VLLGEEQHEGEQDGGDAARLVRARGRARVRVRVRVRVRMVAMPPASTGEGSEPRSSHSTSTLRGVPSMVPMEMKSGWVSEMPSAMRKLKPRSKSAWLRLG